MRAAWLSWEPVRLAISACNLSIFCRFLTPFLLGGPPTPTPDSRLPTPLPLADLFARLMPWGRRAEQRAAFREVLIEIRHDPMAGCGLYYLLDDAGLLADAAKKALAPLIDSIEHRATLDEEDLKIKLPMAFEPITDVEQDTLTAVIGDALKTFARSLPKLGEREKLLELLGLNDVLRRHAVHTAPLTFEVALDDVLAPLLQHCGERIRAYRKDRLSDARPGDYFQATRLKQRTRRFPRKYVAERDLEKHEVVRVEKVWKRGYFRVRRLSRRARYSRRWRLAGAGTRLPKDDAVAVVHHEEGQLYRLDHRYEAAVSDFVACFGLHLADQSVNPFTYQPTGPR